MGVSCAFSLDSSGKKPQLRNPWVPGQLTPGPQGIQESLRYLYLCYFLCSICQTLAHTLSSYLCLFTNASTGEVGHARDKKLKGSSSKMFTHKMHWQEQRQSSQRKSSQAAPRPSRARRAATKKPIAYVEASEESEYEYDSVEDEHYEGNDDVEITAEDDEYDETDLEAVESLKQMSKPDYHAMHELNPYVRAPNLCVDPRFCNHMQHRVFEEILKVKDKLAPHKSLDLEHVHLDPHLYPGVYRALAKMGLTSFVNFNRAYNEELILRFYAIMWFARDDARTLWWMSGTRQCHASMDEFAPISSCNLFLQPNDDYGQVVDRSELRMVPINKLAVLQTQSDNLVTTCIIQV